MQARLLTAAETHPLRLLVLRPGGTLADVDFANDATEGAFHLGIEANGGLIAVGSFYPEPHPALIAQHPYRLRGMATHPAHQGNGAGSALLRAAFAHLHALHADLLWCNARVKAVRFYERAGFHREGELFDIPGIGGHYLMHRDIGMKKEPGMDGDERK